MRKGRILLSPEFLATDKALALAEVFKIKKREYFSEEDHYELSGTSPLFDIVEPEADYPLYAVWFDNRNAINFKRLE